MPSIAGRLRHHPRVILYARVSRDQRGGRSVAQQLDRGRRIAAAEGWEIVREYSDNDRSASQYATKKREDWPKVEADIADGAADILWVWEISRGTRDMVVWAHLARACESHQMHIALDEDLWDTTNPDHMRYLHSQMVDAVYEVGKTRKRILRNVTSTAQKGAPHGVAGYGFRREYNPRTGELVRQVVDPEQAQVVREIARRYLAGETLRQIAGDLNRRGVPNMTGYRTGEQLRDFRTGEPVLRSDGTPRLSEGWQVSPMGRFLERPALIGKRVHRGHIVDAGGWDAILSEADWWAIQAKRAEVKRGRAPRDGKAKYLLSYLAVCGACGAWIQAIPRPRRTDPSSKTYTCRGLHAGAQVGHVARAQEVADAHVEALVVAEFAMPDVLERFRSPGESPQEVEMARQELARLRAELEELYADVESGRVSRRLAQADEARLEHAITQAQEAARPQRVDAMAEALADSDPAVVVERWRSWSVQQKRAALRAFTEPRGVRILQVGAGRKRLLPSESVEIVWRGQRRE